jgi:ATP/maltotriose-dependent transcriptional regulator MalT
MSRWWRNSSEPELALSNIKNKGTVMEREKAVLTKITRPCLQLTYQRTELYRLLDELSATPLIVVNGLPGSGKTTLIASYIENRNIQCLWYQVDRDDKDLATFFHYLGLAALKLNACGKIALPQVATERAFSVKFQAKEYFQKLYKRLESPFMLVLDNYHELPTDAALHDVIAEACAALPPGGRIVLINNNDGRVNLPNLHIPRAVATLSREDLQLSPREVKEIAALHGVRLPSDQAAKQLQVKVGGWVAGLVQELQREYLPDTPAAEAQTV